MNPQLVRGSGERQAGLTLVELMVAMALGLAIVVAVSYVFLQSRTGYRVQDGATRMQEDIRFVQDIMTRDIRSAGFFGCPNIFDMKPTDPAAGDEVINLRLTGVHPYFTTNSATWLEKDGTDNDRNAGVNISYLFRGFDGGASWPVTATTSSRRQAGTDTLMILKADGEGRHLTRESVIATDPVRPTTLTLATSSPIPGVTANNATAVMVVSSCSQGAEVIKPTVKNGGLTFELDNTLNVSRDAAAIPGLTMKHSTDVIISKFSPVTYYVGSAASSPSTGLPTLYRLGIQDGKANNASNGIWNSNDIGDIVASGVENMQLRYLIDSDGDGAPDTYMTSTQIDALGNPNLYWQRVTSVEVTLTFITPDGVRTMTESQTAQGLTTNDSKLRQVVRFTVEIRNAAST